MVGGVVHGSFRRAGEHFSPAGGAGFGDGGAVGMILFVFILGLTFINNKYVRVEK